MQEIRMLEEAVKRDPCDVEKQYELALAYMDNERYSQATGVFDSLIKSDGKHVNALYSRGVAHMATGNYRQAGQDRFSKQGPFRA